MPSGRLNVNREELFDLRSKFGVNLQRPELASFLKDFTKRDMLRGNPSMVSKKFSEALEELKKSAAEYKKKRNERKYDSFWGLMIPLVGTTLGSACVFF